MTRALCLFFFLPSLLLGSEPVNVRIMLSDGCTVTGILITETITVQTAYGPLAIPSKDVRTISFGLHLSPEDADTIAKAIKSLGSNAHAERDSASKTLAKMGRKAIPSLASAMQSKDRETLERAKAVFSAITERNPAKVQERDIIVAVEMTVHGKIKDGIRIKSRILGDLAIALPDVENLKNTSIRSMAMKIDSHSDQWVDTGIEVRRGEPLLITADGVIDIWPPGKGQYPSSPQGSGSAGKDTQYPAGALIGKFGDSGKTFLVGERHDRYVAEEGKLWLRIIASTWNTPSKGEYDVKIRMNLE